MNNNISSGDNKISLETIELDERTILRLTAINCSTRKNFAQMSLKLSSIHNKISKFYCVFRTFSTLDFSIGEITSSKKVF